MPADFLDHPIVLLLLGGIIYFAKDIFTKSQNMPIQQAELQALRERIVKLEANHASLIDLKFVIVRLEEQVKNLAEDIKHLLEKQEKSNG